MEIDANLLLVLLGCVAVRWATSFNSYSGQGKPPMFGDYEAQRHWMEITYHLPVAEWYRQTEDNDLQYWGLDYPPLTAYHSQAMGALAHEINSSWVELNQSRGIESSGHKLFMRYSVIVADILVFFPAVVLFFKEAHATTEKTVLKIATVLLYPGLILIDHGHFQYNCISLGLAVWAVLLLVKGRELLGSIAFTLALNYKQMELYHAMPFFCFLLGLSFKGKEFWLIKLAKIGIVVVLTFFCCWMPFLKSADSVLEVLHRLFPFARGLYEDKVANVWCSISVIIKLKRFFETKTLIQICLATTFLGLLPSSFHLIARPSIRNFKYALVNSSLVFFLFSFQVHEKSILLVAIPACLLLTEHPFACSWFLFISTFSMLPLFIKDQLVTVSVCTMALFSVLAYLNMKVYEEKDGHIRPVAKFWCTISTLGCAALTVTSLLVSPPPSLPDLHAVLVSCYSCLHFIIFLTYFSYVQLFGIQRKNVQSVSSKHELKSRQKQGKHVKSRKKKDL